MSGIVLINVRATNKNGKLIKLYNDHSIILKLEKKNISINWWETLIINFDRDSGHILKRILTTPKILNKQKYCDTNISN